MSLPIRRRRSRPRRHPARGGRARRVGRGLSAARAGRVRRGRGQLVGLRTLDGQTRASDERWPRPVAPHSSRRPAIARARPAISNRSTRDASCSRCSVRRCSCAAVVRRRRWRRPARRVVGGTRCRRTRSRRIVDRRYGLRRCRVVRTPDEGSVPGPRAAARPRSVASRRSGQGVYATRVRLKSFATFTTQSRKFSTSTESCLYSG